MRQFFTKKELKLKKKRLLMMVACMAVLLAGYVILTWPKKVESEAPTVIVESAEKGDVEIYEIRNRGLAERRQKHPV